MSDTTNVTLRLGVLGFVTVLVQIAGVSQIRILGVNADLAPLVVAAAGFLTGALPGAVFGFGIGIFLDLAFVQTLGVSALVYALVGYGAGRVRELRAPGGAVHAARARGGGDRVRHVRLRGARVHARRRGAGQPAARG